MLVGDKTADGIVVSRMAGSVPSLDLALDSLSSAEERYLFGEEGEMKETLLPRIESSSTLIGNPSPLHGPPKLPFCSGQSVPWCSLRFSPKMRTDHWGASKCIIKGQLFSKTSFFRMNAGGVVR